MLKSVKSLYTYTISVVYYANHRTVSSRSNAVDLYWVDPQFVSRPGHRLSWLRLLVVSQLLPAKFWNSTPIKSLPPFFQILSNSSFPSHSLIRCCVVLILKENWKYLTNYVYSVSSSDVLQHLKTSLSHKSVDETRAVELCYCFHSSTLLSGFDAVVRADLGACHHSAMCDLHFSSPPTLGNSDHMLDVTLSDWPAPPSIKSISWSKYIHNLFKKVILTKVMHFEESVWKYTYTPIYVISVCRSVSSYRPIYNSLPFPPPRESI